MRKGRPLKLIKYIDINCTEKAKLLIGNKIIEDTSQRDVYDYA